MHSHASAESPLPVLGSAESRLAQQILLRTRSVIYLYDPHAGRSLYQNRPLADLAQYSPENAAAIPDPWRTLMHPDDVCRFPAHRERLKRLRSGEIAEFEFRLREGSGGWRSILSQDVPFEVDSAGTALLIVGHATDITLQKRAESRLELLLGEFDHRMKNLYAMVQAVVRLTYRSKPDDFLKAVDGRLSALSSANAILSAKVWQGLGLYDTLVLALKPYNVDQRVEISGTDVMLSAAASSSLALVFNELVTNAIKYGALSSPEGRVTVMIGEARSGVKINWQEQGGPVVAAPKRTSFGTKLVRTSVDSFDGRVEFSWLPGGLGCRIWLPGSALDESAE